MGGTYLPENAPQSLAVLSAFISSINIAGMNYSLFLKDNLQHICNSSISFTFKWSNLRSYYSGNRI